MSNSNMRWISVSIAALLLITGFQVMMGNEGVLPIEPEDIVATWSFNEGSGQTAVDGGSGGFDLRLGDTENEDHNDPLWADGISGSCLDLNGVDDYAIVEDFDLPSDEFTFAFWAKTSHKTITRVPISYGTAVEENEFFFYNCQNLRIYFKNVPMDTGISITDGEWHHIALTWKSSDGNVKVFKDSELRYNYTWGQGEAMLQDGAIVVGQEQDVMGGDFDRNQAFLGKLDEVMILNRVLAPFEIEDYYDDFKLPPRNFNITSGDESVLLKWDGTGSPDGYNVHRATAQNGLMGEYFATENFTDLKLSRVDRTVDLNWGQGSPDGDIGDDLFSMRWSGFIKIDRSGIYEFIAVNDDRARLWVNGSLLIIDPQEGGITSSYGYAYLDRGFYPIRLDYIETDDISAMSLQWSSDLFPEHVIPSSHLFWGDPDDLSLLKETSGSSYLDDTVENGAIYAYSVRARYGSANSTYSDLSMALPSTKTGISLIPTQAEINPGETFEFMLSLYNDGGLHEEYSLDVDISDQFEAELSQDEVYLAPGTRKSAILTITSSSDIEEGSYDFIVTGTPTALGDVKEAAGWLIIDEDPRITDLLPLGSYRSSDPSVLVSWRTPVNSTTEVYLRKEGSSEYDPFIGENGTFHQIVLEDLEQEIDYQFFVVSSTDRGYSRSTDRTFRVGSKVVFDKEYYDIPIKRDYDQTFSFSIRNMDDVVHVVEATVYNPHDDLIVGFVGDGSEDARMSSPPGESEELTFAVHAQDAMKHYYMLLLNLTTIDDLEIYVDQAALWLDLDHVFVDLEITKIAYDMNTLSKRFRIKNNGDPLTDLSVNVNPELEDWINFEPHITHGYLGPGASFEVEVSPFLNFHFPGLEGVLNVSAFDTSYEVDLSFQVPEGWDIFAGSLYPNWGGVPTVYFDEDDQDNDGISNDLDDDKDGDGIPDAEDPLPLDTDNDGIPNSDDSDDDGDGQPDMSDFFPWDFDNDGTPDEIDPDRDADGVYNHLDPYPDDHDNDTIINGLDDDDDNDQIPDYKDNSLLDHDNDGWQDWWDPDYDGDGIVNWDDQYPEDMDNDGTPDSSDDDIDGDGTPNEDDEDHNRKPGGGRPSSPGGVGGGGGGGWDSEEGEDQYCTNDPEIDLFELLSILWQLYNIGKAIFGFAMIFASGGLVPLVTAIVTAVVMNAIEGLKNDGINAGLDAAAQWAGASSWSDLTNSLWGAFGDYAKSSMGIASSHGPKYTPLRPTRSFEIMGLRPGVQQYFPDPLIDTSKLQSTLVTTRNMYVYFHQDGGDGSEIWIAYTKDLGASLKDYKKMTNSPGNAYWPYMDCGTEGNATLVWIDDRDGHDEVYMRRTENAGKDWTEETRVTDLDSNKGTPLVAYDRNNNIHVFWVDDRDGFKNIFVKKLEIDEYAEEETWTNDYRVTYDYTESTQPVVHIGEDDELHLIFIDNGTGSDEIYHRESSNQQWNAWSFSQITDSGTEKGEPAVTISKNGTMHVVWRDSRHGESEIYYQMVRQDGGPMGDEVRLTNDEYYSEYPSIDHAADDLFLSWHSNKTGWDTQHLVMSLDDGYTWSVNKRIPMSPTYIDTVLLELELEPMGDAVSEHDIHVLVNGVEIGNIDETIPDGKYLFDVPLDLLNLADSKDKTNKVTIKTEHMNSGHYVVATNWTLMWHYTNMHEYVCAPDQEAADEYVRNGTMDRWTGSDVGVYSNSVTVSDKFAKDGDEVQVDVNIRNLGGADSRNIKVSLYADNIDNESNLIGGPIEIAVIPQGDVETVTFDMIADANISRIYAVVENLGGGETDDLNNIGNIQVEFSSDQPPSCSIEILDGKKFTMDPSISLELEAEGSNRVKWVSISNDNVTWTDWDDYYPYLRWVLDHAPPETRAGEGDGFRTVYVKVKDTADLVSDIAEAKIYLFMEDPAVGRIPSVEDDKQSLSKPLKITFSGPMNQTSVEEAFTIDPSIEGEITWENFTLIFTPTDGWEEGQEYIVTLGDSALDFFGRNLTENMTFSFTVVDEDIGDDDDDIVDDDVAPDDDDSAGVSGAIIATIVIVIILILIAVIAVVVVISKRGKEEEEEGWGDEE